MNKAERIATFDSGSTRPMTPHSVDLDERTVSQRNGRWGNSWVPLMVRIVYLIMSNPWFNEYTFRLDVDNEKYVPEEYQAAQQKPIMDLFEDPLFQEDM